MRCISIEFPESLRSLRAVDIQQPFLHMFVYIHIQPGLMEIPNIKGNSTEDRSTGVTSTAFLRDAISFNTHAIE